MDQKHNPRLDCRRMLTFLLPSKAVSWMSPFLLRLPLDFFLDVEELKLLWMQPLLPHLVLILLLAVEELRLLYNLDAAFTSRFFVKFASCTFSSFGRSHLPAK